MDRSSTDVRTFAGQHQRPRVCGCPVNVYILPYARCRRLSLTDAQAQIPKRYGTNCMADWITVAYRAAPGRVQQ